MAIKLQKREVVPSNFHCECRNTVKNVAEFMEPVRVLYAHDDVGKNPVYICTLKCRKCGREIEIG